ncbi:hypothetical protein [Chromobacterium haemolyticum]|uniref:hypothetical protein n=1 Tax=Chromobacterium TaxID=535 RepID=UPI0040570FB3
MITYKDLTERYSQYDEARSRYWRRLGNAANQLTIELTESLQLPAPSYRDEEKINRYVDIGRYENEVFESLHPQLIPGDNDLSLRFVIRVVLETSPNSFPKLGYIQAVEFREESQRLRVTLPDGDGWSTFITTQDVPGRFTPVIEQLKQMIFNRLDVGIFD